MQLINAEFSQLVPVIAAWTLIHVQSAAGSSSLANHWHFMLTQIINRTIFTRIQTDRFKLSLFFCFVFVCFFYLHLNFSRSLTLPTAGTMSSVRSERLTQTDTCSLSKQVCLQNKSIAPPFKSTHIDRGVEKCLKTALCWRYSKIRLKLNKRAKRCEARLYLWFYFENIKGSLVSV